MKTHCRLRTKIADAILFLADEKNGFITGTILTIDGGWTAGKKM